MRYALMLVAGAVLALGIGLAIGYMLPPEGLPVAQVSSVSGVLAYQDDEDPEAAAYAPYVPEQEDPEAQVYAPYPPYQPPQEDPQEKFYETSTGDNGDKYFYTDLTGDNGDKYFFSGSSDTGDKANYSEAPVSGPESIWNGTYAAPNNDDPSTGTGNLFDSLGGGNGWEPSSGFGAYSDMYDQEYGGGYGNQGDMNGGGFGVTNPNYGNTGYGNGYGNQQQQQPWYVSALPGIGRMIQQMIPGQQTSAPIIQSIPQPVVRPTQPARPTYPQPACWISAQPTVVARGGSSTLTWSSFNASSASLGNGTTNGKVQTSDSHVVQNIQNDTTYVLSVAGPGGSSSCYTRITVQQVSGPPSCIISANPDTITRGQTANIAWGTQNALSANLNGAGTVPLQGGLSVGPSQSTTYSLTVTGSNNQTKTCAVQLTVR